MPLAASMRRKRSSGRPASRARRKSGSQASGGDGGRGLGSGAAVVVDMLYPCRLTRRRDGGPTILCPAAQRAAPFVKSARIFAQFAFAVEHRLVPPGVTLDRALPGATMAEIEKLAILKTL